MFSAFRSRPKIAFTEKCMALHKIAVLYASCDDQYVPSKSSNIERHDARTTFNGMLFMQTMHKFNSFSHILRRFFRYCFLLESPKLLNIQNAAVVRVSYSHAISKTDEATKTVSAKKLYRTAAICIANRKTF